MNTAAQIAFLESLPEAIMTIRAMLDRKRRRIMLVALAAMTISMVGYSLAEYEVLDWTPRHAGLPGLILFIAVMCYAPFAFRCPRCRGSWPLAMQGSESLFRMDRHIKYCPLCGCDIDAENPPPPDSLP